MIRYTTRTKFHQIKYLKMLSKNSKMLPKNSKMFPQIIYYSSSYNDSVGNLLTIGIEYLGLNLNDYIEQNKPLDNREMKLLFYNIIKIYYKLREKNIVHWDVSKNNILVKSSQKVYLCDFEHSFNFDKNLDTENFPTVWPKSCVTKDYLSPELMAWYRLSSDMRYLNYDPFKSEVFSLGLIFLSIGKISIEGLNKFGEHYDIIHIKALLTISYNYIVKDSLKVISYKMLANELQNLIDERINLCPYDFLKSILRKMLEVDMVKRSTINDIYHLAKCHVGNFA
ncbi:hypothetical protein SteCoe_34864 [Stentor coeruleus]|uniref:Protein kinase domain-containing protein n=1 Tax=Stentor coeruleus TaxID=5963 RepID=A0A1R2ATZ2_9CILI|nr:hypothetical protein SteCoe_34864 [Stentor coeruleus]